MSEFEYPDAEMQIWNNAAFENGAGSEDPTAPVKPSWWNRSLESTESKENLDPVLEEASSLALRTPIRKPLRSSNNVVAADSQENCVKAVSKRDLVSNSRDERMIDMEIEEIEKEIRRLTTRLDALRLEKAEVRIKKTVEKRGKAVAAKFLEPKQSVKIGEQLNSGAKPKVNRRGMSLGPAEIVSASKTRFLSKQESAAATPFSAQNRRKSCFWKLGEIDELKATKERGKSSSVSPRSRKTACKTQAPRQAVTTITSSKKPIKKEDGILGLIQPKNLFKDGEKSVQSKRGVKPGRIVASRYNQIAVNQSNGSLSEARKRSLPENENKEEGNKRRASRENGVRVKKKWEIPNEVVVVACKANDDDDVNDDDGDDAGEKDSLRQVSAMREVLPRIRTARFVNETPRDSGAAKRVADLVGRKPFFGGDVEEGEETGDSVLKALSFGDDDDE